jgi:hypothetical protein
MKKGEMSMAMIIGAIIAIVILVIIVVLILGANSDTRKATSCAGKGGICVDSGKCSGSALVTSDYQMITCSNAGQTCCSPGDIIP